MTRARTVQEEPRCTTCRYPSDDEVCSRCRGTRDRLPEGIAIGDWVRLRGEQKVYRLLGFHRDGSAKVYGGDKDPEGHRCWRALPVASLVAADSPYGDER